MSDPGRRFKRIIAVADAKTDAAALRAVSALAEAHGAALEIMGCIEPPKDLRAISKVSGRSPEELVEAMVARLRDALETHASALPDSAEVHVAVGKGFIEIIRRAVDTRCDLVIKRAEPLTGLGRFFFASTDQHLLRKCPCPVWLQTCGSAATPRRVLAAVDVNTWDAAEPDTLDALNRRVLDTACAIAGPEGGEVIALHAWDAAGEGALWAFGAADNARADAEAYVNEVRQVRDQALYDLVSAYQADMGDRAITPRLARGAPEHVIETEAEALGIDCVVIGTVAGLISGWSVGGSSIRIWTSGRSPPMNCCSWCPPITAGSDGNGSRWTNSPPSR